MNKIQFLRFWSLAVGAMDAVTGLLLVFAPGLVLKLLGIAPPSADVLVFVSWIGVFVAAVGISYAMALGGAVRGETVWYYTALVRIMVAVFLTIRILDGTLAPAWGMVAGTDFSVGAFQVLILWRGWWREVAG